MKIQDFAFKVAMRTMELLEHHQHYKIPDDTRKEIAQSILREVHILMKQG